MIDSIIADGPSALLDEKYYHLNDEELTFFKSQTGIQDEGLLKEHIMKIQADAWKVHPYGCVLRFVFTKLKISQLPAYRQLLKLGKERKGALFLDTGCCFGNDVRKAVVDGFPIENVIGTDLYPAFWDLGHQLFCTTPETFPVPFLAGDVFDPVFLETVPPFYAPPETVVPDLASIKNLTPLLGHLSVIHASSFFHLFDEAQQLQLARSLAGLLSPKPGSMIFGEHGGRPEKGYRTEASISRRCGGEDMFCHSPETWAELWDGGVFEKGTVKVDVFLHEIDRDDLKPKEGSRFFVLVWCVTRL
ncbi:hypothetical protein AcV5_007473 [Taiwanofungus camphoratus]|nr:hypothetical protein AcW2_007134 [Antrodia cinnamomea]KAI0926777.1 hypothetical protein AcV5_007473 [Antrodia cinnamomea]